MKKRLLSLLLCCFVALAAHSGVQYILNEGFESGIPATWTQQVMSTNSQLWVAESADLTYPTGAFQGNGRVALRNTTGTTQDYVTRLITPQMNLPYGSQYQLWFAYASASNAGDVDSLTVYYSTDGTRWQKHTGFGAVQNSWKEVTLDLIGNGATYQLAFEAYDKQGRGVVLDAVRVFAKSECTDVENFSADVYANSVDLTWQGDFGATFQLIVDTVSHDLSTLVPAGAYLHYEATTNDAVNVPGLQPQTTYYAYVRSVCDDNESGFTAWKPLQFTTAIGFPYTADFSTAIPAGWQNLYGNFDGELQENTTSYKWTYSTNTTVTGKAHVYSQARYYYNSGATYTPAWLVSPAVDIASVPAGSAIELTFRLAITGSSSSLTELSDVYKGYSFFHVMVSTDGGNSWERAKLCPATDYLATARRVRVNLSEYVGVASSLKFALVAESQSTSAYFHVDDVKLQSFDAQCGDVQEVTVSASDVTADVAWTVVGKNNVVFQLSKQDNYRSLLINDTINALSYSLSNLTPYTTYYVRVKQLCEDAEWVEKKFETAAGVPFVPTFTSTFPSTWTRLSGTSSKFFADSCTSTTSGFNTSTTYPFGAAHLSAEIYSTTYNYWVVSPAIYLNPAVADHVNLTFEMALTNWNSASAPAASADDRVWVVISEDGGATWSRANATLWSANPADSADYDYNAISNTGELVTIPLDAYIGKNIKVAFGCETPVSGTDNRIHFHHIAVKAYDPACVGLKSFVADANITDAVLRWTIGGTTHNAMVQVSTNKNYTDTVALVAVEGVDTLLVENLAANTKYYARAYQNCSGFEWADALTVAFATHCQPDTIPYVMSFEDETANQDPGCWTIVRASGDYPRVNNGTSYSHGGSKCLSYGSASSQPASIAALPAFTVPVNTLEMSFWLRAYNSSCTNTLEVGVMTNPYDESTFVRVASFSPKSTTYEEQLVSFNSYNGTGKYIAFRNAATGNYGFCIDDINVHALPNCFAMGEIEVNTITSQGATLLFATTNAANYQVVAATEAINIDSLATTAVAAKVVYNEVVASATGEIVLSDAAVFQANTTYYIYVRGVCSETEAGKWSKAVSFTTECKPFTPEEFGTETFSNAKNMACWKTGFTTEGSSSYSATAGATTVSGFGKVLKLSKESANSSTTSYSDGAYVVTPEFAVADSINKYQISFSAATNSTDVKNVRRLVVGVVSSPTDISTKVDIQTLNLAYANDSTVMKEFSISLENYMGDYMGELGHYVIFQSIAGDDSTNYVVIDNVRLEPISSCKMVNEVTPTAIGSASATLTWESTGAAQYQVVVDTVLTKNVDAIANPIFTTTVSAPTVDVTGLASSTNYYAYVRSLCGADDASNWSSYTAFTTSYGIPFYEAFDQYTTYETSVWKIYAATVPQDTTFSVDGLAYNTSSSYKMSFQNVPTHISGMSGKAARTECYSSSYNGMLQSPAIDLTSLAAGDGVRLSLKLANVPYSGTATIGSCSGRELRIFISEDGGNTFSWNNKVEWNCDGNGDFDYNDFKAAAKKYSIDLSDYAGKNIALLIASTSSVSTPDAYLYIDSIAIEQYDNSCIGVSKIKAEIVDGEYVVSWQRADAADVYYEVSADADFSSLILQDTIAVDSFKLSNWTYGATYYVRVKTVCGSDWASASFKTPLGLPFLEDFQAEAVIPAGWMRYSGNVYTEPVYSTTSGWYATSTAGAGMSANHIYSSTYYSSSSAAGYKYALLSPTIVLNSKPGNLLNLTYKLALTSTSAGTTAPSASVCNGRHFSVAVLTDSLLVPVQVWSEDSLSTEGAYSAIPTNATEQTVNLSAFAGKTVQLLFFHSAGTSTSTSYSYVSLDDIKIQSVNPNCMAPALTVVENTTDSVVVAISGNASATYQVEVSTSPVFASVVASKQVTDTVASLGGLTPATQYYVRAKMLCGGDEESAWSENALFVTDCAPFSVPFNKEFTDGVSGSYDVPLCWTKVLEYGNYPYVYSYYDALYFYGGSDSKDQIAAFPEMAMPLNKLTLNMSYESSVNSSSYTYGTLKLGYLTSLDGTFHELAALDQAADAVSFEYVLAGVPADAKYLALRYNGGTYEYGAAYVYSVSLTETPSCLPLKSVEFDNISRREFDLVLTPKLAAAAYDVVLSTTQLTDSALAAATPITIDTTVYHFSGLMRNTLYYVYVRSNCGEEDGVSAWTKTSVRTKNVGPDCSESAPATLTVTGSGSDISPISAFYKNSYVEQLYTAAELQAAGLNEGYVTSIAFQYILSSAYTKQVTLYVGTTASNTIGSSFLLPQQVTATQSVNFREANKWYEFELATPIYWDGVSSLVIGVHSMGDNYWSSGVSGFAGGASSNTVLYRRSDSSDPLTGMSSTPTSGSTRANVHLSICPAGAACPAVKTVSHELLGDGTTSARISWTASNGDFANSYSVVYADSLITDWTNVVPQIDSVQVLDTVLTGLTPYTDYYVYVITHCDADGMQDGSSEWSEAHKFRTNSTCLVVEDLDFHATGKTSAVASWFAPFEDNNFVYILSTESLDEAALEAATPVALTDTFVTFSALSLDETYYLYVAHSCGTEYSPYLMAAIHTSASCPAVANLHTETVTANTVLVAWDRAEFGEETEWEVGIVGRESVAERTGAKQALIIGLEPDMDYTVYVKALCSETEASALATLAVHTPEMPAAEIGLGNGTSTAYLVYTSYGNTYSQHIYTAAELNAAGVSAGTITSVAFNYSGTSSSYDKAQSIYIGSTSATSFSGNTAADFVSGLDLVYGPEVRTYASGWQVYELDTPFDWDGQSSIVVGVLTNYDGVSGPTSSTGWSAYGTSQPETRTIYRYRDNTLIDVDDLSAVSLGNSSSIRPNILFGFEASSCAVVKNLTASDITINSAKLSWLPGAGEVSWAVVASDSVMTSAALAAATPDTLTYKLDTLLTGLTPDKDYHFYVRSLCSSEESDWKHLGFTTLPTCSAPIQLSVAEVADTVATLKWKNITAGFNGTYRVAVGLASKFNLAVDSTYTILTATDSSLVVTGLKALTSYKFAVQEVCAADDESRWSAIYTFRTECGAYALPWSENFDNSPEMDCWTVPTGVSVVSSSTYAASGTYALRFATTADVLTVLPSFGEDINGLRLRFKYRSEGSGSTTSMGTIQVGYLANAEFTALESYGKIYAYTDCEVLFRSQIPAGARMAIRYHDATSSGWYAFIDNVQVDSIPNCSKPALTVTSVSTDSIVVKFDSESDYNVWLSADATFQSIVDSVFLQNVDSVVFAGLSPASTYFIRAQRVCGATEVSEMSNVITQATACAEITTFPWSEDFNTLTAGIPACWDNSKGTMTLDSYKWNYHENGKSGACVRMNSYTASSGQINYLATPELVIDTTLVLTFDWKNPTGGDFEVLVSTDGLTFTTVARNMTGQTNWAKKEIHLDQFIGQMIRIYFKGTSNYGSGDAYLYIDNVMVNTFNANCQGVATIQAENIGLAAADIHYNMVAGSKDAYIEVSKSATFANVLASDTVRNDSIYHVTGLAPSTTYYVRVKQLCGGDDESAFASASFTTIVGVRYAPVFATTGSESSSNWKSATGTAEEAVSDGSQLSTLSGWSLTAASSALNAIHFKANVYGTSSKKWLVSPSIDLSPNMADGIVLSFDAALTHYSRTDTLYGEFDDDRMVVLACVDDSVWTKVAEWNNDGTGDYRYDALGITPTSYQLDFSAFAGKRNVRFAFYGESTEGNADNDLHVGNFVLDRKDAITYLGDACQGDDYNGAAEGNSFYVAVDDYQVGENRYTKIVNDTVYILLLSVHEGAMYEYSATICEGETYADDNFNLGVVTLQTNPEQKLKGRYQTAYGCDSTIILHLTINPIQRVTEERFLCPGSQFTWNGQTITTVGNYTFESTAVTGCDSIVTLAVKWDAATERRETMLLCADDEVTVAGQTIKAAGDYVISESEGAECDHTLYLHVVAASAEEDGRYIDTVKVEDLPYYVGTTLVADVNIVPGTIHQNVETSCGTTVLLQLTIVDGTGFENIEPASKVEKLIIDGHLVIIKNGIYYTALGARLN